MTKKMFASELTCPVCNGNLLITRLESKLWCPKCREFRGYNGEDIEVSQHDF